MIGARKDPLAELASAIAGLDFGADNAELERLKADHVDMQSKRDAVRAEIQALTQRISTYAGPDPAKVAEAIIAGMAPDEAASAGVSRVEMEEKRDALVASLDPIRERIDRLAAEIEAHKAEMLGRIAEAVAPYVQHLRAKQVEAAETLLATEAALIALSRASGRHPDPDGLSERAREGVTGHRSLLGWRDALEVPPEVLAALRPLVDRCGAVSGLPTAIPLR